METRITREERLIVGKWYALCYTDESPSQAPLAQYIGDREFCDDDGAYFQLCQFDYFILQN